MEYPEERAASPTDGRELHQSTERAVAHVLTDGVHLSSRNIAICRDATGDCKLYTWIWTFDTGTRPCRRVGQGIGDNVLERVFRSKKSQQGQASDYEPQIQS